MENFLYSNLTNVENVADDPKYKDGLSNIAILEGFDITDCDPIYQARFFYVRNLALRDPKPFKIPQEIEGSERALMYLSSNDFEQAISALGLNMGYKVIGVEATGRTGKRTNRMFIYLHELDVRREEFVGGFSNKYNSNGEWNGAMKEFRTKGNCYRGLGVKPLEHEELIFLYVKMKELCFSEENKVLLESKMVAFVERVLYEENKLNEQFLRAFEMFRSEFLKENEGLEKRCRNPCFGDGIFRSPIVFEGELDIQLGTSLMDLHDYGTAYEYLKKYPLYKERIGCLIELRKAEGAISEIRRWIEAIGTRDDRGDAIVLSNLYIKLGHLLGDAGYFDMAAEVFGSSKPHKVKGLWMYKQKRFAEAEAAFRRALEITACDDETRYLYAHTLMELERYSEALRHFRMLSAENTGNADISRSLSFCYYKIGELEKSLVSLKSVALEERRAMNRYVFISMRNGFVENIKWALKRMANDAVLSELVNYILQYKVIPENEMIESLEENPNLTENEDCELFN